MFATINLWFVLWLIGSVYVSQIISTIKFEKAKEFSEIKVADLSSIETFLLI